MSESSSSGSAGSAAASSAAEAASRVWTRLYKWVIGRANGKFVAPALGAAALLYTVDLLRRRDSSFRRAREIHGSCCALGNCCSRVVLTHLYAGLIQAAHARRQYKTEGILRTYEHIVLLCHPGANQGHGRLIARWLPAFLGKQCHTFFMSESGLAAAIAQLDTIQQQHEDASVDPVTGLLPTKPSVRVVVAGGDGSVVWTVQKIRESKHHATPLAVIPLGTGNDMSGLLGWGVTSPDMNSFLTHAGVSEWMSQLRSATVVQHDVWQVAFSVQPGTGAITQIRGGAVTTLPETSLALPCINYSSIGMDARLVHAVELHRLGSRFLNRLVYGIAGCITVATPTTPVTSAIARWKMQLPHSTHTRATIGQSPHAPQGSAAVLSARASAAASASPQGAAEDDENSVLVDTSALGVYHTLMFLNAHSYGGGTPLWDLATQQPQEYYRRLTQGHELPWPLPPRHKSHQDETDGVFEVLGSSTLLQLGWTTSTGINFAGGLHQLAKSSGLQLQFDPHFNADVPMQVDGEAYILKKPAKLSVELLGKATVLKRKGFNGIEPWLGKLL